jgi:hypothetical protein
MNKLFGKKILLVVPRFFGYEREIIEELQRHGAQIDWLPDRPFDTPALTALTKIGPQLIFPLANRLYEKLLGQFGSAHYDWVLVVNGQTLSSSFLQRLRGDYPSAIFVLYLWDSLANRSHVRHNLSVFDRVLSFDHLDAKKYNLLLRPLFYGRGFTKTASDGKQPLYDISFVGTAHSDRFAVVDRVKAQLAADVAAFWYLYLQAPWVMHYYRLTKLGMKHARSADFEFKPLTKAEVQSIFSESNCILDIEHPSQVGLTMRTFETLGAQKKIVTTNVSVRDYDFFKAENICVIDRATPNIPADFLQSPFAPIDESTYAKYAIGGWLKEVLDLPV